MFTSKKSGAHGTTQAHLVQSAPLEKHRLEVCRGMSESPESSSAVIDPYAPPSADLRPASAPGDAQRRGRRVVLAAEGSLPRRCFRCNGEPVVGGYLIRVRWAHPLYPLAAIGSLFLPVVGVFVFLVFMLTFIVLQLSFSTQVEYFACDRHARIRRNGSLVVLGLLVAGGLIAGFTIWQHDFLDRDQLALLNLLAIGCLGIGVIAGLILSRRMWPRVWRYTGGSTELTGLGRPFVDSLSEWQGESDKRNKPTS